MSVVARGGLRLVGACVNSGTPNTGEQRATYGGGQVSCIYSGMVSGVSVLGAPGAIPNTPAQGADIQLWSGPGRLKDVLVCQSVASGQQFTFYDAAVATSGGPFVASGHNVLGFVPAGVSGITGAFGLVMTVGLPTVAAGQVLSYDTPFHSGLCLAMKSGVPGLSISFCPDIIPTGPNVG